MKVSIQTIPHTGQRYNTIGDWQFDDNSGDLTIFVSSLRDHQYECLVAIHELVEAVLCRNAGISTATVDDFDLNHQSLIYDEPGDDPLSPYHWQHIIASIIERVVAYALRVDWQAYEARTNNVTKQWKARQQ